MDSDEEETPQKIACQDWFVRLTGYHEDEWRKKDKLIRRAEDGSLTITNSKTGQTFNAGTFKLERLGDLIKEVEGAPPCRGDLPPCVLEIVSRADGDSIRNVDVAHLQAIPENRHAVFQVASNFNGVEAISEGSAPDRPNFTEDYIYDLTQGPAASVSAGAAAITRVHAAFYDPSTSQKEWTQTKSRQVNFLGDLQEHFPTNNGYVVLTGREPPFPKPDTPEYQDLYGRVLVGYHHNTQVTTGHRSRDGFEVVNDPAQVVDQVFCAAMNIGQGMSGMFNKNARDASEKCQFILDTDYEATYLSAIKHQRTHLYLTLIGGGVFGNRRRDIYSAIIKAHAKWASHPASKLEVVSVVLFSEDPPEGLGAMLKPAKISWRWVKYLRGRPVTQKQHYTS